MVSPIEISIIIATFNRAHFIEKSLASIQKQTFKNWECLIIDDGSSDNTVDVVSKFIADDPRFTYLKRSKNYKKGLPGCRNYGLDKAVGSYIVFFDDDDIVHPENLQICVKILQEDTFYFVRYDKKPFTGSSIKIVPQSIDVPSQETLSCQDLDKIIMGIIPFASCCVMWDKRCFQENRFNEELMYAEEWECYSRILSKGYKGVSLKEVLYFNRKHSNSNTGEFYNNDKIRVESKIKATELIIQNLGPKRMVSPILKKFFIRLGFQLKSKEIINISLKNAASGRFERLAYNVGFHMYPVLRPLFIIKGKLKII